jgi:hypothetical protein
MPREGGVSSTPGFLGSIADASVILDHPPSRMMTAKNGAHNKKRRHRCRRFVYATFTRPIN